MFATITGSPFKFAIAFLQRIPNNVRIDLMRRAHLQSDWPYGGWHAIRRAGNRGGTPTRRMLNHVNWGLCRPDISKDFNFPDYRSDGTVDDGKENVRLFLGPKEEKFAEKLKIPVTDIERARNGEGKIYVWGWTEYDDVFPFTRRHRTEFCNEVEITCISVGNDRQVTAGISFRLHREHNCIDDECK